MAEHHRMQLITCCSRFEPTPPFGHPSNGWDGVAALAVAAEAFHNRLLQGGVLLRLGQNLLKLFNG